MDMQRRVWVMPRTRKCAVWLLSLSLFVFAFYFLLTDGWKYLLANQSVSIPSTAVMNAFHVAVEYKGLSILGLMVLLSALTILRGPTVRQR